MSNIYELTDAFNAIWQMMEDGTIDDETLQDVFNNTTEELSVKLEGYCKFIKNLESDIAGFKDEITRLSNKKKVMENTIDRAKFAMQKALTTAGEKKMPCGTFMVSIQNNPPKCVLDASIADIPSKYLIPQEPTVDRKLLLEDLKASDELVPYAHIEHGESLRIR